MHAVCQRSARTPNLNRRATFDGLPSAYDPARCGRLLHGDARAGALVSLEREAQHGVG